MRKARLVKAARAFGLSKRGFPFMVLRSSRTPMGRIRSVARSEYFAHRPLLQRWALRALMTLAWPIGALLETRRNLRQAPADIRPSSPWESVRQGWQMWRLAMLHNVPPVEFNSYRLADKSRQHLAGDYFYWCEANLLRTLNTRRGASHSDVQDKARFADICQRHALPCIPTLAVFREGRQDPSHTPFLPDQARLWVKDLHGRQGSGTQQWLREATGYRDITGQTLQPTALVEHWRQRDCIVQPWLHNHPTLAEVSHGPLVTLRIVTGITLVGEVQVVAKLMMLFTDEHHGRRRPILCAINAGTGKVTRSLTAKGDVVTHHPLTGKAITDLTIPHWQACVELVQRAHRQAFERFVFLGWDVAVTPDGPVLIETNAGWGCLFHQLIDDTALGDTPFASIALEHLEAHPCA
ncbi:sugar-transfer associated ATP-grasp domain-containing protein [Pseudomonas sp. HLS-6 TE3448]|jgi:hypothetical protein